MTFGHVYGMLLCRSRLFRASNSHADREQFPDQKRDNGNAPSGRERAEEAQGERRGRAEEGQKKGRGRQRKAEEGQRGRAEEGQI